MTNFFKKLFIPNGEKTEVIAYKSWVVRWESRYGGYSTDFEKESEIFPSREDANLFADQLKEAFKLLRYRGYITNVEVETNQSKIALMPKI